MQYRTLRCSTVQCWTVHQAQFSRMQTNTGTCLHRRPAELDRTALTTLSRLCREMTGCIPRLHASAISWQTKVDTARASVVRGWILHRRDSRTVLLPTLSDLQKAATSSTMISSGLHRKSTIRLQQQHCEHMLSFWDVQSRYSKKLPSKDQSEFECDEDK